MGVNDEPLERDRLVTTLVERYDLLRVAGDACLQAGIPGRSEAVAYCLIVLSAKADPQRASAIRGAGRTYKLDLGSDDFAERLQRWAETIAANLHDWATTYTAIHDELDRFEITTLRSLIRISSGDDVIDLIADKLAAVLVGGQRLEDMTVERAREPLDTGAEYVFQSPLSRWVMTSAKRAAPWDTDPIGPREESIARRDGWGDPEGEIELREALDRDAYDQLVERVAGLADTRSLLPAAIDDAERLDRVVAVSRLAGAADCTLFGRLRAELAHVADELRSEQAAFSRMLAYIVLAMRAAPILQGVTILSLRVVSLERAVIDHVASRIRALLGDERQPTPRLLNDTTAAGNAVPGTRLRALKALHGASPGARATELLPVSRLLDELPPTVASVAAIGAALPKQISESNVATSRGNALRELGAVDELFARVFRRYAMGLP